MKKKISIIVDCSSQFGISLANQLIKINNISYDYKIYDRKILNKIIK